MDELVEAVNSWIGLVSEILAHRQTHTDIGAQTDRHTGTQTDNSFM